MTQNRRIAVTGGIGSGKSAVLALLGSYGYPVFSCDEIYAELCRDRAFLRQLNGLFPSCVKNGALDRAALSQSVFSDPVSLEKLNRFTHPLILRELLGRMREFPLSFAEVPLLFEGDHAKLFDGVIVVLRERAERVAAVKARSGLGEEEILARMARQFDYERLPEGCMVLDNNGSMEALASQLRALLKQLDRKSDT